MNKKTQAKRMSKQFAGSAKKRKGIAKKIYEIMTIDEQLSKLKDNMPEFIINQ